MHRRTILCAICIIAVLLGLSGCAEQPSRQETNPTVSNEIWCNPVYMPDDIDQTNVRMLNMPNRQQYSYKSSDGTQRIVIDIRTEDFDEIAVENRQRISIGSNTGVSYVYNGETITYGGIAEAQASGLIKIAVGETVLEWSQAKAFCRVYGTYSIEELMLIAEALEVRLP